MIRKIGSCIIVAVMLALSGGCDRARAKQAASSPDPRKEAQQRQESPMTSGRSKSGYDITRLPPDRVAELAKTLDPEAYAITQKAETERAFTGALLENKKDGVYGCAVCGLPLFSSENKFNSGTGWPSFWREFDPQHVSRKTDHTHGMVRTEITCARCGAHLGHLFPDGPPPTGERHCLNSASLKFYDQGTVPPPDQGATNAAAKSFVATEPGTDVAYFAGGCFWGLEHYFQQGPGVIDAQSGYMQGRVDNPTYQQVCSEGTGHAETVKVIYDPRKITYRRLLEAFFMMHDPTQLDRQGPDVGAQYRSGIWYVNDVQKRAAQAFIKEQQGTKEFTGRKIVTQVEPAKTFFPAEDYHQDYLDKTGGVCHVKDPW